MTPNHDTPQSGTQYRVDRLNRHQTHPVLFINTIKFWGGGELKFLQCAHSLHNRGYDVAVAARTGSPLCGRAAQAGLPILALRGRSDYSPGDALRIRRWLRGHRGASILCATTRDVKLVKLGSLGNRFEASVFWMMGSLVLRHRKRDRTLAIKVADRFIVPSDALRRDLEALDYIDSSRITVLPNGLDLTAWPAPKNSELLVERDGPIVGVFSRLDRGKGIDLLLDAWPQILKQHPNASLWIAGTGSEMSQLRKQAEPFAESVTFYGFTENVRDLMLQVEVVVQPSRYEAFGNVLLEAMACAKPIVCTAVGGMMEFVDESCGVVVPTESPSELASSISSLLSDPQRAIKLGAMGRKRLEDHYSLERMIDRLEMLLERLL